MKKAITFLFVLFCVTQIDAQTITGKVTDTANEGIIGANVYVKGTTYGTTTDLDGNYSIYVASPKSILVFSFIGYNTQEHRVEGKSTIDVRLESGINLGEVQVVGSRSYARTATDSPVAIDVINVSEIANTTGKVEINQMLQYAAPSFNATKQSGSDGADHVDPASLRGLGPDQTLVLINGKRQHQSSLINVFGTRGRGNTGTDLNAIPATAIKRIEVLRDGASA